MTRADEIIYLHQKIHEIEESEKSKNQIKEITIPAWMFVEIARHFLNSCLPAYIKKIEKELTVIS